MHHSNIIPSSPGPVLRPKWWTSEGSMDQMRDSLSCVFNLNPIESDQNTGICRGRSWTVDGHLISQATSDAAIVTRTRSQVEACHHLVHVHRYLYGQSYGVADNINLDKPPGEVFLTDQALQIELVQTRLLAQSLYLPKALLGYDPDQHAPYIRFSQNPVMGDLLNEEMNQLFRTLFRAPDQASAALQSLIACLTVAIGAANHEGDIRTRARHAMTRQICAHIEKNLESPDLGVEEILRNFGVSRATLYRMFEEKGGVRQYISDRRLYRAVVEICETPNHRGSICAAADKWGFSSSPSFNRAVKRKFGVPPGALTDPLFRDTEPVQTDSQVLAFFS